MSTETPEPLDDDEASSPVGPELAALTAATALSGGPSSNHYYDVPHTIWENPFVQKVVPFLTALLIHIAVIGVGYIIAKQVPELIRVVREQVIIPEATMVEAGPQGGIPHPGLGSDPTRDAAQDKFPDVPKDSRGIAEKPGLNLNVALMAGGGGGEEEGGGLIGIGPGGLGKGKGLGAGRGDGYGAGDGDGAGQLAPFGVPGGGGGIGIKSNFIGIGGNARRIVYLCDASGTMVDIFDQLRQQLRKSIDGLKPIQAYNVIFFSDDNALTLSKNTLLMATPDNKRKTYDYVDTGVSARGRTNPMPAIKLAFDQGPELMYVLTDGFDQVESFEAVVNEFRRLNKDKKVKVNTILIQGKTEQKELIAVLQKIADENGGIMKVVNEDEFDRQ